MRSLVVVIATVTGVLAAAFAVAGPAAASGTAYVWSGGGDDSTWGDAANWSPVGVPGDGDAVTVEAPDDTLCHAHVTDVPDAGLEARPARELLRYGASTAC